jgi:hypothetical protein
MLGLRNGKCYQLMVEQHVFTARKLANGVYAVTEAELPWVAHRIMAYIHKLPLWPDRHMPVKEAADVLRIQLNSVYLAADAGRLEWAPDFDPATGEGEHWKCVTRESVRTWLRRRGMKDLAS